MLNEANRGDQAAWQRLSNSISGQLRNQLLRTPVGETIRELMHLQVGLIRSIPIDAAARVHELAIKAIEQGHRSKEIADDIRAQGAVSAIKATLIARTEVGRAATVFLQARCQHVGITHYIWRTAHDRDVRPGHREMEGTVNEWANPPAVNENGRIMHHHPGEIWNCRCYAEPVIPDDEDTTRAFR